MPAAKKHGIQDYEGIGEKEAWTVRARAARGKGRGKHKARHGGRQGRSEGGKALLPSPCPVSPPPLQTTKHHHLKPVLSCLVLVLVCRRA